MIVVPCGGKKLETDKPVQARYLYTGSLFKTLWDTAATIDPDVRIMSAKYGLILPNTMLMPYNKKMDKATAKVMQSFYRQFQLTGFHLLPSLYAEALGGNLKPLLPKLRMGYMMQAALKIKGPTVLIPDNLPDGEAGVPFPLDYKP